VGGISGFFIGLWLVIGSFYSKKHWQPLPSTTANCSSQAFYNISSTVSSVTANNMNSGTIATAVDGLLTSVSESASMYVIAKAHYVILFASSTNTTYLF